MDPGLVAQVREFREKYPVSEKAAHRIVKPSIPFFGRKILEMSIAALLKGENLLLTGPKATGKNVLAENLAYIFNRPSYNVSFHVNTNSGDLIGTDTFEDNQVKLRKGSIYRCAEYGGFGILDEINPARSRSWQSGQAQSCPCPHVRSGRSEPGISPFCRRISSCRPCSPCTTRRKTPPGSR